MDDNTEINVNDDFLPIGSVVILKGGFQKMLIIARAINVNVQTERKFFDYGACIYPIGMINEQVAYFNKKDINKVVFTGYSNEEDKILVESIVEHLKSEKDD